jgi:tetratricopeptide (TPR) repeat protein
LKFDRFTIVNWYLQFVQLLINLNKENDDRQPLINHLKEQYADNQSYLKDIEIFEREYLPSRAIEWYTRNSFVYRILNKAFRSFDMEILILFRFFIADLYQQLHQLYPHMNTPREVIYYRGQEMYKSEIDAFKIDQRICCTSFLSTTCDPDLALNFFTDTSASRLPTDPLQPVLFHIRPFHFHYNRSTLANISDFSHFGGGEQEVLFAVGSCFRIARIWFDGDIKVWMIDLEEDYVQDKIGEFNRPFHIDIITMGFYLLVEDDDFRSVERFYNVLLKEANPFLWIISCQVGLGLIEYYRKNYSSALEKLQYVIETIDEDNLQKTCQIMGNIYCILGNIHREMKNDNQALEFYQKAAKATNMNYFIDKERCFWEMYIYKTKLNPFVKDDKYFYYCDRPLLNMVLFYKGTRQWNLARNTFQKVFHDYFEQKQTGDVEMFVKILEYNNADDFIHQNREFLGGKTFVTFLDEQYSVLYAYEELGRHYLNHRCPDYALLCYQEILQCQSKINELLYIQCFDGIGRVREMKEEYTDAVIWFKKAMDISTNHISKIDSSSRRIYEKLLLIFNNKLNDPLSAMVYMKEIINYLIENNKNNLDARNDFIATILKITVHFYHSNDKTKIQSICDYIQELLNKIEIKDDGWKKWLCIGSICDLTKFQDDYHRCEPIIDENYNVYLKLYQKIFDILSNDTSEKLKTEIGQCEQFLSLLKITKLDRFSAVIKLWALSNEQMNPQRKLTRSLSQSSFFVSTIEHRSNRHSNEYYVNNNI